MWIGAEPGDRVGSVIELVLYITFQHSCHLFVEMMERVHTRGHVVLAFTEVVRVDIAGHRGHTISNAQLLGFLQCLFQCPGGYVHQIKHGDSWTVLDRWTQPGANISLGKFGFYIPGNDQVALPSFAHYVDLNIR